MIDELAALVLEAWRQKHDDYYHCGCHGTDEDCPSPKPAVLVVYEQR